jgi:hypothetical protein
MSGGLLEVISDLWGLPDKLRLEKAARRRALDSLSAQSHLVGGVDPNDASGGDIHWNPRQAPSKKVSLLDYDDEGNETVRQVDRTREGLLGAGVNDTVAQGLLDTGPENFSKQQMQWMQRAAPDAMLAASIKGATADRKNYRVDGMRTVLATPAEAAALQAAGHTVAEAGAASADDNLPQGMRRNRETGGVEFEPGFTTAQAGHTGQIERTKAGVGLEFAGPMAAAQGWGSLGPDVAKARATAQINAEYDLQEVTGPDGAKYLVPKAQLLPKGAPNLPPAGRTPPFAPPPAFDAAPPSNTTPGAPSAAPPAEAPQPGGPAPTGGDMAGLPPGAVRTSMPEVKTITMADGIYQLLPNGELGKRLGDAPSKANNLSPTEQKEYFEADDALKAGEMALGSLRRAMALNDRAASGMFAPIERFGERAFNKEEATASTQFNTEIMDQALTSMKAIFGSNPTEGERAILLEIQAAPDMTREERKALLNRAIALAERRIAFNKSRIDMLLSGGIKGLQRNGQGGEATASAKAPSEMTDEEIMAALQARGGN